jgi:hypothetical protein
MAKKKGSKKPKSKESKPPQITPSEKEESFDFGGLPDRDFKKNLGCG